MVAERLARKAVEERVFMHEAYMIAYIASSSHNQLHPKAVW